MYLNTIIYRKLREKFINDGNILIIEGQKNTDLVVMWGNKRWFKINGTSAMTDLGWNVKHALFLDFSQILKLT